MTAITTKIHPNSAESPATPRNPSNAAMSAMTKKVTAQCNIAPSFQSTHAHQASTGPCDGSSSPRATDARAETEGTSGCLQTGKHASSTARTSLGIVAAPFNVPSADATAREVFLVKRSHASFASFAAIVLLTALPDAGWTAASFRLRRMVVVGDSVLAGFS